MRNSSVSNIKEASTFQRLMNSINSYIVECQSNEEKVEDYIFLMDNRMHQIKDVLQQRLYEAEIKLRNCDNELTMCRARISFDSDGQQAKPDCSSEEHARIKAKRQQEVAQKNMNDMEELMRYADRFVQSFRDSQKKFSGLLDHKLPEDAHNIKQFDDLVKKYIEMRND